MRFAPALGLLIALVPVAVSPGAPSLGVHPVRILVEAPAQAIVGQGCRVTFLVGDTWGPEGPTVPTAGLAEAMRFDVKTTDDAADLPGRLHLSEKDAGLGCAEVVFRTPGLHRVVVVGEPGLVGESAPVRVLAEALPQRIYWGDLHGHLHTPGFGHAGRLDPDDFARTVREGLEFGRDVSNLDFCAFTPHVQAAGGLARAHGDAGSAWEALLREVESFHEDGRFVVFPGYEWQGPEGDHCVVLPGPGPLGAPFDFLELAEAAAARGALLNAHAILVPSEFEPRVAALTGVEVTRDCQSTERLGLAAIARGVAAPFLGCSDTHGGAIGATSLTGIRAPRLTRAAVLEAIRAGRCWATNGERIVLDFAVDATRAVPTLRLSGVATGPIDRVEFLRNGRVIATVGDVADSVEFAATHEDRDLFCFEWLDDAVIYHARVLQTTVNRYDPSWRDLAVASPLVVRPCRESFDGAHGVSACAAPGEALMQLRAAWDSFRAAPGLPLAADDPAESVPEWTEADVAELRAAVQRVRRLAAEDTCLGELGQTLASAPLVAESIVTARQLLGEIAEAGRRPGPPSPGALARLEAGAKALRDQVARARAAGREDGWSRLEAAWFGMRLLDRLGRQVLAGIADLGKREAKPQPAAVGDPDVEVTRFSLPLDPRVLEDVACETPRLRELREQLAERWGYTSGPGEARSEPVSPPEAPVLQVRVIAEGSPTGAVLNVGTEEDPRRLPLVRASRGWVATLTEGDLPVPGGPPLLLEFASPVRVERVFVEDPEGRQLRSRGRLAKLGVHWNEEIVRPAPVVVGDSLDVRIELEGEGGRRVLLDAVFPAGEAALAFPRVGGEGRGTLVARWGFAGWHRVSGTEVPGSEVVRPVGFGALPDGRAVLAYEDHLLVVDLLTGARDVVSYPRGREHERGRELCIAPLTDGTVLVRGARGPLGGWAARLEPVMMTWTDVASGPEAGTVAPLPGGGYAWLVGRQICRRDAAGADLPPLPSDVTGRLLGFDCRGRAIVRVQQGETVRLDPFSGAVVERVSAVALAVDPAGALVILDGHDRRHPEFALAVRLRLSLPDGGTGHAHRVAFRTSPVLDPPVMAAVLPDGALLLLGGTTWWRREPVHDWWGVNVERWEPLWAGVTRAQ